MSRKHLTAGIVLALASLPAQAKPPLVFGMGTKLCSTVQNTKSGIDTFNILVDAYWSGMNVWNGTGTSNPGLSQNGGMFADDPGGFVHGAVLAECHFHPTETIYLATYKVYMQGWYPRKKEPTPQ